MTGFQKLLCLGLERTPASDLIEGTVMTWCEVLTVGLVWDQERDTPRIRAAFTTLAATRTTWPLPRDFIDALPRVERKLALPSKPADPAKVERLIRELAEELRHEG